MGLWGYGVIIPPQCEQGGGLQPYKQPQWGGWGYGVNGVRWGYGVDGVDCPHCCWPHNLPPLFALPPFPFTPQPSMGLTAPISIHSPHNHLWVPLPPFPFTPQPSMGPTAPISLHPTTIYGSHCPLLTLTPLPPQPWKASVSWTPSTLLPSLASKSRRRNEFCPRRPPR